MYSLPPPKITPNGLQKLKQIKLGKVSDMTQRQIAAWQKIAQNHNRQIRLKNGLQIEPDGKVTVNEAIAKEFEDNLARQSQQPPTVEKV